MINVVFLSIVFTLIIIAILLIFDFIRLKQNKIKPNFGIKFMVTKTLCNRKSGVIYTSIFYFSLVTGLLSWGLIKLFLKKPFSINFYYSFWIVAVITLVVFLIFQNFLILMAAKTWNISRQVYIKQESNTTTFIEVFDNRENKILDKYDLYELVTYLKIFFEGISFLLALYVIGLNISKYNDDILVKALNLAFGLCIFIPLISLKLEEQRLKFLRKDNNK
ncbi:hypothetical protein F6I14_08900 [Staphylococcus epidermidis]|uniref:hypothetical protein n=1 Tax=Staphylococcus epidermidis TaxID=1282 RepID=UPI001246DF63|nr:hypothetical protein [Staphylococcus epidermidis]KAA9272939.1 hypothetical protein F6I14_08900 [Staphylococcus epidermidis]